MEDTPLQIRVHDWLDIALSDLNSARIIYYAGQHANSLLLFQQAVEKANKAFALYTGFDEKNLKAKIGHNTIKIHRKLISDKKSEIEKLILDLEKHPAIKHSTLFNSLDFSEHYKNLQFTVEELEHMEPNDLSNFSRAEICDLLDTLDEVEDAGDEISAIYNYPDFKIALNEISDFLGEPKVKTELGGLTKTKFDEFINDENNTQKFYKFIRSHTRLLWRLEYIYTTFILTALLTVAHATKTRYSEPINPLKVYTKKLPLVQMQTEIMDTFEFAIVEFKKIIRTK